MRKSDGYQSPPVSLMYLTACEVPCAGSIPPWEFLQSYQHKNSQFWEGLQKGGLDTVGRFGEIWYVFCFWLIKGLQICAQGNYGSAPFVWKLSTAAQAWSIWITRNKLAWIILLQSDDKTKVANFVELQSWLANSGVLSICHNWGPFNCGGGR
ncbi:hypothetical protein GUJ93_ZPchr0008g12503 [Zizania palustris]|uniref:Uncharacterized protein n=1 Tax=Zizania palustris TaxID=103762 RepID=A0A8J5RIT3_ZIZPA|nr:hypothetical protein GUJ93_ZPchr0008g12503 [Zizania palustris]